VSYETFGLIPDGRWGEVSSLELSPYLTSSPEWSQVQYKKFFPDSWNETLFLFSQKTIEAKFHAFLYLFCNRFPFCEKCLKIVFLQKFSWKLSWDPKNFHENLMITFCQKISLQMITRSIISMSRKYMCKNANR
jgi:hypothetical protein